MNDLGEEVLPKGKKYTQKMLYAVEDFAHLSKGQWVADDATNKLVNDLIHNYKIKLNDLQGPYAVRNSRLLWEMNCQQESEIG
jgi:DNA-directed RNA polymerase subunit beta